MRETAQLAEPRPARSGAAFIARDPGTRGRPAAHARRVANGSAQRTRGAEDALAPHGPPPRRTALRAPATDAGGHSVGRGMRTDPVASLDEVYTNILVVRDPTSGRNLLSFPCERESGCIVVRELCGNCDEDMTSDRAWVSFLIRVLVPLPHGEDSDLTDARRKCALRCGFQSSSICRKENGRRNRRGENLAIGWVVWDCACRPRAFTTGSSPVRALCP